MIEKMNRNLILITDTYPFGAVAESFLDKEIPYLSSFFDSIIIVPRNFPAEIEKVERKMPDNVVIDTSLLKYFTNKKIKRILFIKIIVGSILFYKEILKRPKIFFDIRALKKTIYYLLSAYLVKNWVLNFLKQKNSNLSQTLFYTYWLGSSTMGVNLVKKDNNLIKVISRAHRYDIYEDLYIPKYLPFRNESMSINRIFCISNHGMKYIINHYPFLKSICSISYLGVEKPDFISQPSFDSIFRIVSCSYIVPVKRIHLIILALKEFAKKRPELKIKWTHIGYGRLFDQIKKEATSLLSNNIIANFTGYLSDNLFYNFYKTNPIDVFINVSASEGIPVSIMEAQSFGIPVIATAVGGTPEIVTEDVGILLSENPSPEEIANAIEFFIDNPEITKRMRLKSIENWEKNFNAVKNFTEFAKTLKMI